MDGNLTNADEDVKFLDPFTERLLCNWFHFEGSSLERNLTNVDKE